MFKKILMITLLIGAVGALVFGAILRTDATNSRSVEAASSLGNGNGRGGNGQSGNSQGSQNGAVAHNEDLSVLPAASASLSSAESDALAYMREEEKLAHDVYMTLYDQWHLPVFQNIANSEQTHTEAVRTLLDRYRVPDPASVEVGVFTDQTLQGLYNQLVQQGSQSLAEALKVGATIEEIDILDLEERLAQTEKADIILVYDNLMKGSRNHLRAFVSTLQTQSGETYQPQYLSPDAYQAIIGAPIESGGRGNPGGKGPRNGRP